MMLDNDQIQKIRLMFSTAGWNEVVKPAIETRFRNRIKALILHPSERSEGDRDDSVIRGELQTLEWLLMSFQNELIAAESNRQLDELQHAAQENGTEKIGSATPANP
jgi:hypothetical protein